MLLQCPQELQQREMKAQSLLRTARELDEKKLELLQQLNEINQSLSLTWTEYGALHNSSVLINRIPSEILCLIFSHYRDIQKPSGDGHYIYEGERSVPEVILSHVCHHWRKVALGFPKLWSLFWYKTPRWKRDSIDRLHAYLSRSYPLCIDLYVYLKGVPHEDMTLLEVAAEHLDRWRGVVLIAEDNKFDWSRLQTALKDKAASNLEYLCFRPSLIVTGYTSSGHISPASRLEPKMFTLGAPKLTQVRLDATVPYFFLPPMSSVTTFCLDAKNIGPASVTWSAFQDIIALPSLESVSIGGHVLLPPSNEELNQPIFAPTLKHLRWSSDEERFDHFLSHLDAPKLETLILCGMKLPPYPPAQDASVSLHSLHSLHMIECSQLAANYVRFLALGSPNLRHLTMSYYHPHEGHLLGYLNQESQDVGKVHWPHLETVTCYLQGVLDVAPYLEFVQARKREDDNRLFTLRVSRRLFQSWETQLPEGYLALGDLCTLKPWTAVTDILASHWPPHIPIDTLSNERSTQFNFAVDWNEF